MCDEGKGGELLGFSSFPLFQWVSTTLCCICISHFWKEGGWKFLRSIKINIIIITILDRVQSSVRKEILKDILRFNKVISMFNCKGCAVSNQEYAWATTSSVTDILMVCFLFFKL